MRAFLPRPESGRVFTARQLVRNTDVTPSGRLRFDALARYLQLAAEDDLADAGWDEPYGWLLRKIAVTVRGFPRLGSQVSLDTFCSGTGPRWAERTTTVAGPEGDLVQATAVWAAVSLAGGRPVALGPEFHRWYGAAAQGRGASVRLSHPRPPAVEDVLAGLDWLPGGAELEYHREILPGCEPRLVAADEPGQVLIWLLDGTQRLASARLLP
jgi:Acyl-ACP thioesterase